MKTGNPKRLRKLNLFPTKVWKMLPAVSAPSLVARVQRRKKQRPRPSPVHGWRTASAILSHLPSRIAPVLSTAGFVEREHLTHHPHFGLTSPLVSHIK